MELTRCDFFKALDIEKDSKVVVLNNKRKKISDTLITC